VQNVDITDLPQDNLNHIPQFSTMAYSKDDAKAARKVKETKAARKAKKARPLTK
jgi:hypothetical protein